MSAAPEMSPVESAVEAWNAKTAGAMPELAENLRLTREKLHHVLHMLSAGPGLVAAELLARVGDRAEQSDPEGIERIALARVRVLDQMLATFQVELRTLHAQAGRAMASGEVLVEELGSLGDRGHAEAGPKAITPTGPDEHAAAEISALRQELAYVRQQLSDTRSEVLVAVREVEDSEVEAMRAELRHVRQELDHARGANPEHNAHLEARAQISVAESEVDALRLELTHVRGELRDALAHVNAPPPVASEREKKLAGRVEALRAELVSMRERFDLSESQGVPLHVQEELDRLRTYIVRMRQAGIVLDDPLDPTLRDRYEKIRRIAYDAQGNRRPMGAILVEAGVISQTQLELALQQQESAWNRHLGSILVDMGYITEDSVAQTLAAQIKVPYVHLPTEQINRQAVQMVPGQLAYHHTSIPMRTEGNVLVVAMANPFDLIALDDLKIAARREIDPRVAPAGEIRAAIAKYYPRVVQA